MIGQGLHLAGLSASIGAFKRDEHSNYPINFSTREKFF
jgi:hypothetical protein